MRRKTPVDVRVDWGYQPRWLSGAKTTAREHHTSPPCATAEPAQREATAWLHAKLIVPLCLQESRSMRGGGVDEQVVWAFPIW
jgi:hypothetical protein